MVFGLEDDVVAPLRSPPHRLPPHWPPRGLYVDFHSVDILYKDLGFHHHPLVVFGLVGNFGLEIGFD